MEYTLRKPKATDIFVVSKIIKGIGLKNISNCFNSDEINLIRTSVAGDKLTDDVLYKIGANIMLSIGDLILEKLDIVKDDVIKLMSNLSGLKTKDVEDLPLVTFTEMFMDIIKEPDFLDFIKVVLKSFN